MKKLAVLCITVFMFISFCSSYYYAESDIDISLSGSIEGVVGEEINTTITIKLENGYEFVEGDYDFENLINLPNSDYLEIEVFYIPDTIKINITIKPLEAVTREIEVTLPSDIIDGYDHDVVVHGGSINITELEVITQKEIITPTEKEVVTPPLETPTEKIEIIIDNPVKGFEVPKTGIE